MARCPGDISADDILKEGWLMKQSQHVKGWRRRWMVLTRSALCSYKNRGFYDKPTEVLYMKECNTVKSAEDDVHKENSFRVDTPRRVFYLIADSSQEKESWIGHIGRQMVRPTVLKDYNDEDS